MEHAALSEAGFVKKGSQQLDIGGRQRRQKAIVVKVISTPSARRAKLAHFLYNDGVIRIAQDGQPPQPGNNLA
jgi:hypothetical protein